MARRLLAIANALDWMERAEAARLAGMDRQALRDWVSRYSEAGVWLSSQGRHPPPFPEGAVLDALACLVTLAAVFDIWVIRAGGLTGAARVIRRLWRMTLALLIAAMSFAGQPKAIPPFLRHSPLVVPPALAVLVSLIYWLIRIRLAPALRRRGAHSSRHSLGPATQSSP